MNVNRVLDADEQRLRQQEDRKGRDGTWIVVHDDPRRSRNPERSVMEPRSEEVVRKRLSGPGTRQPGTRLKNCKTISCSNMIIVKMSAELGAQSWQTKVHDNNNNINDKHKHNINNNNNHNNNKRIIIILIWIIIIYVSDVMMLIIKLIIIRKE